MHEGGARFQSISSTDEKIQQTWEIVMVDQQDISDKVVFFLQIRITILCSSLLHTASSVDMCIL